MTGKQLISGMLLALFAAAPLKAETPQVVYYTCAGEKRIEAVYVNEMEVPLVILSIEGALHVLPSAISASGARYAEAPDGQLGLIWWEHHDTATLERGTSLDDSTLVLGDCVPAP